ncbi:MAG: RNase P subunit p30 family protein, partial [Candidatus Altarchaeaceae archaeon]
FDVCIKEIENFQKKEFKKIKNFFVIKENEIKLEGKKFVPCVLFEKFNLSKIRKNLDKIILCNAEEEAYKHNEVDIIVSEDILEWKLLKEMEKNYVSYAFNFSQLLNLSQNQILKNISIMQKNFKLLKKYNVNYVIGSFAKNIFEFKTSFALLSYGKSIGMSDEEARNAITKNYEKILNKFKKRNDKFYITEGFRIIKLNNEFKKKMYGYY